MLQLTKRTEYGLIALVHMADHDGRVVSVREIGEHYPVPRRLMAEVLKDLAHAGLVASHRGATGGYELARSADRITLAEIVTALEGQPAITNCEGHDPLGDAAHHHVECEIAPTCRIRSPLHRIRENIFGLMERTTLRSLTRPSIPIPLHAPSPTTSANDGDALTA